MAEKGRFKILSARRAFVGRSDSDAVILQRPVKVRKPPWHDAINALRRGVVGVDWLNRRLPWRWWCAAGATDAIAIAWVLARRAKRPLRFVQIGSNDGVVHDPIHLVVRTYGWSGLLVEPVPDLFARLVENYEGVEHVSFENAAIGPTDGTTVLYCVTPRPDDPYWVDQLASLDRSTVLSHSGMLKDLEERIVELPIASLTVPTLVERHRLGTIDLLHIDVEGYDAEVLHQIDFGASWAPVFIIYERQHLDVRSDRAVSQLLRRAGYHLVDIWPDRFAHRASPGRMR